MLLNIQFTEHININIVQVVFFPGRELLGAKKKGRSWEEMGNVVAEKLTTTQKSNTRIEPDGLYAKPPTKYNCGKNSVQRKKRL